MDWLNKQDVIEILFALLICGGAIYAIYQKDTATAGMCIGAAIMYIKGKSPNQQAGQ